MRLAFALLVAALTMITMRTLGSLLGDRLFPERCTCPGLGGYSINGRCSKCGRIGGARG